MLGDNQTTAQTFEEGSLGCHSCQCWFPNDDEDAKGRRRCAVRRGRTLPNFICAKWSAFDVG